MFKHITYKLLFFLPIILLTLFINYFVDPYSVFENSIEKDIAQHIIMGGSVYPDIYNDRMVQKYLIFNKPNTHELIVLGSSRTMTLNKDIFPEFSFFNHSVVMSTLGDILAIYEMLIETDKEPNIVIIGVDPWFFNRTNQHDRFGSIGSYYCNFINRLKESNRYVIQSDYHLCIINPIIHILKTISRLLSLEYFQLSITTLIESNNRKKEFKVSQNGDHNIALPIKLPDGSVFQGFELEKRTIFEVNNNVTTWIYSNIDELKNFHTIDQKRWDIFTSSILFLKNRGIKVVIVLPPYHPIAYNFFKDNINYKIITDVENNVKTWSKDNNIPVIWSYDPILCGYDDSDFYDATHLRRKSVERNFKAVFDSINYIY